MSEHEQKVPEFSFKNYFVPFSTAKAIHFLIIIGFLLYGNGLLNGFVGDDFGMVVGNNLITSLGNLPSFFFSYGVQNTLFLFYRPVILTYFTLVYTIFGANPFIFHFLQLLLHIASTSLVFLFLTKFFKRHVAFLLAIIFLIHPITSETVFYISYTQDILFFFFGMLSLLYLTNIKTYKTFILVGLFSLLSLFSKETGILFLSMTIVYEFLFAKNYLRQIVITQLAVLFIYILLRIHSIGIFVQALGSPIGNLPFLERIVNMPAMFLFYLKTFLFPLTLVSSYEWFYTKVDFIHVLFPLVIDLLFLSVVIFLGFLIKKKSFLFFAIWFLTGILFHLQIISLDQTVAERWFYFPMIGMLGMIGVLLETFRVNLKSTLTIGIIVLLVICLSLRTFIRSFDWRDEFTIASHDITISQNAWGLDNELSYAYYQKGNFQEAKMYAEKSIELYPYKTNYLNLGAAEISLGEYADAKKAFSHSIQLGGTTQAYDNLAFLSLSYGTPKENINFIKNSALPMFPTDGNLWLCLAALEYNFGDRIAAQVEIAQAYKYAQSAKSSQVISVYNAIMNDKPVKIGLTKKL